MKYRIAIIFTLLAISGTALAVNYSGHSHEQVDIRNDHSGGTDSSGCHAGTKPYHCH